MVIALYANPQIVFEFVMVINLVATATLDPIAIGNILLPFLAGQDSLVLTMEPSHAPASFDRNSYVQSASVQFPKLLK